MFVLEIIAGPFKGQAQPLTHGHTLSVGRSSDNELCLPDPRISAKHAEITWNDEGFNLFDLGSANGTFVNGQRIHGRVGIRVGDNLQFGDVIIGLRSVDLEIETDVQILAPSQVGILAIKAGSTQMMRRPILGAKTGSQPAAAPSQDKTILPGAGLLALGNQQTQVGGRPGSRLEDNTVAEAASLKQKVEAAPQGATLIVHREDRFDPFWSMPVTIGREHGSGIVLDDNLASLRHAVVDLREQHYLIRDVGSSNGVFINHKRIVEQRLQDGDVVTIGTHTMLVVLGERCLGLQVQPPSLTAPERPSASSTHLGLLDQPLAGAKRKKKKASDLVWYGTSDLDRGVFRARSALIALVLGIGLTFWMLLQGDSRVLAGAQLSAVHESGEFVAKIAELGQDRCTACHVGAGQVSTLKCLDCHPDNRPLAGHAEADVACARCHQEHRGDRYKLGVAGLLSCKECHEEPHEKLKRTKPRLVATFALDAVADVEFHLHHDAKGVRCLSCHATSEHSKKRGIRGACSQCHAPEHPEADACQQCHLAHPDRAVDAMTIKSAVPPEAPPRFAFTGFLYALGLLVMSFSAAALVPRKKAQATTPDAGA